MVWDGRELPTILEFETIVTHNGEKISPGTYYFTVEARNWVDTGKKSDALEVVIPYRSSPDLTTVDSEGTTDPIQGAVTATVTILASNEAGEA